MVAVMVLPVFSVPAWIQAVLLVGGVGVSAVLSGWLPKHPKVQKTVTAFALAFLLATAMLHATKPRHDRLILAPVYINCDAMWWTLECWLFN